VSRRARTIADDADAAAAERRLSDEDEDWATMMAERKGAAASTQGKLAKFVPFTDQSLQKIADRVAADEARHGDKPTTDSHERPGGGRDNKKGSHEDRKKDKPNTAFVAGKQFPEKFGVFPAELYGKPIEDLDEFYNNKYVSIVQSAN